MSKSIFKPAGHKNVAAFNYLYWSMFTLFMFIFRILFFVDGNTL